MKFKMNPQYGVEVMLFKGAALDNHNELKPSFYFADLKDAKMIHTEELDEQNLRKIKLNLSEKFTSLKESQELDLAKKDLRELLNANTNTDIESKMNNIVESLSLNSVNSEINNLRSTGKSSLDI